MTTLPDVYPGRIVQTLLADLLSEGCVHLAGMHWDEDKWPNHNVARCDRCRACRFDNVCLNHTSLEFQYYMDSEQIPLFYDFTGNAQFVFPTDFINTGTEDSGMRVHLHQTYASFQCMQNYT